MGTQDPMKLFKQWWDQSCPSGMINSTTIHQMNPYGNIVDPTVFFYRLLPYYKLLCVTLLFIILSTISTYGRFDFSLCWPLNLPCNKAYSIQRSSPKWASATLRKTRVMSNNLHAKNSPDITLRARSLYLDSSALIKTISLEEQGIWRRKNNYHIGYWPPGDYNFHFVIMQLMIKDARG